VSVGILWGSPGTRTCGIFVGHAEGLVRDFGSRFRGANLTAGARVVDPKLAGQAYLGFRPSLISEAAVTGTVSWPGAAGMSAGSAPAFTSPWTGTRAASSQPPGC
jgi:hypothetical protein